MDTAGRPGSEKQGLEDLACSLSGPFSFSEGNRCLGAGGEWAHFLLRSPTCLSSGTKAHSGKNTSPGDAHCSQGLRRAHGVHSRAQSWLGLQRVRGLSLNCCGLWQIRAWRLHGGPGWADTRSASSGAVQTEGGIRWVCSWRACLLPSPHSSSGLLKLLLLALGRQLLTIQTSVSWLLHIWELEIAMGECLYQGKWQTLQSRAPSFRMPGCRHPTAARHFSFARGSVPGSQHPALGWRPCLPPTSRLPCTSASLLGSTLHYLWASSTPHHGRGCSPRRPLTAFAIVTDELAETWTPLNPGESHSVGGAKGSWDAASGPRWGGSSCSAPASLWEGVLGARPPQCWLILPDSTWRELLLPLPTPTTSSSKSCQSSTQPLLSLSTLAEGSSHDPSSPLKILP